MFLSFEIYQKPLNPAYNLFAHMQFYPELTTILRNNKARIQYL